MYTTTFISKTTFPFCHKWQKVSKSSSRHIITGRASILIFISIITIRVTMIILVLRCLGRRRRRLYEATKASLSSSNTTDTGVHLTQLITKCVKASIHAHKLCHDGLESHLPTEDEGAEVDGACDMQHKKHHGLSLIQTYQHTSLQQSKHTSKMHDTLL